MTFSRRTLSLLTIVLVVGALSGGIYWRLQPEDEEPETSAETAGVELSQGAATQFSADVPQPVAGAPVIQDTLWISVRAAGQAAAYKRTTVTSLSEGVVRTLPVRENGIVREGDLLVQLDTLEAALAVAQAEAELVRAETEYRRTILLDDQEPDPEVREERSRLARVTSGLAGAEVSLRQERLRLERATVRAPFGGRVADLQVVEGQHIASGTELMTLVDLDPIKVEAEVLEAEIGVLREGRRAEVTFAAFPGETFVGRIESINPVVDPEQRTSRVTILLPNPGHRIKPGMYADVRLDAEAFPDRILVPRTAILERGEGRRRTMLFVYEGDDRSGEAMWRYVATGLENDEFVEIVESDEDMVEPGEIVLVDGHHFLAHQTPVRLVEDVVGEGGRPTR